MNATKTLITAAAVLVVSAAAAEAHAHCQVPCGIYDDHARVHGMYEDVATIDKAVKSIAELAGKTDAQSINQVTRWITTKDEHATKIQEVVAQYFLAQKIKPADPKDKKAWAKYVQMLADHHAVIVLAMKTKQTVDPKVVAELRAAVTKLERYWPGDKKK